jgi:NAD(P)-dependent dehydrogenase (short-subunit alcohol dehydrogenase family)
VTLLVTGANRGLGRGLLELYRSEGRNALGTTRGAETAELLPLDVTDPAAHRALAGRLAGRPIDLLVCNAGVYLDRDHRLETGFGADLWAQTFAVNVTGVFLTVQALLPNLRAARGAKIAVISSQMASHIRAPGGSYIYRASKAAALNLGRNLAADLRGEGIAVGIYDPGWTRTDMGGPAAHLAPEESVQAAGRASQGADLGAGDRAEVRDPVGRPRCRRQGRHDQAVHGASEPALCPGLRADQAQSTWKRASGSSSATSRICRRRAKWCSTTAAGTTARGWSG